MPRRLLAAASAAAALLVPAAAARAEEFADPSTPGPALSVPAAEMAKRLQCSPGLDGATRAPVLLVQGTGARAEDNWSWTYEPAFDRRGIPWCAIDLPDQATGDVQVAGEHVVYALREMYRRSGRKVAIVGHSQGGMVPRWALRWWPDTRAMVDDVIGFAPSNHGTTEAACSAEDPCSPAGWQQRDEADFIRALNSSAETWKGIDYTSVYTRTDETVKPNQDAETGSSSLRTGEGTKVNVATQDVCPTATYEHLMIGTVDPVAYALALDALDHPGPADPSRVPLTVCAQPYHEGINTATVALDAGAAIASFEGYTATTVPAEPALAAYTRPQPAPAAAASCRSKRRFAVTFPALRGARATLGGRPVRLTRTRGGRLRAVVDLRGRAAGTVVLRVRGRDAAGRTRTLQRRYRTCTARR